MGIFLSLGLSLSSILGSIGGFLLGVPAFLGGLTTLIP